MTSSYVKSRTNPVTGKTEYRSIGSSIKANDGNKVSGYLVRFTDADDPDLHGEYFTKSTNFWLGEHGLLGKPVMIDHAFDDKFKSVPVGIIDFIKQDEIGIWIEAKLKERAEYEDMLRGWKDRKYITLDDGMIPQAANGIESAVKTFFNTGKVQWSSGALPQSVEVADDGHIESWPFIEGTGVMTPAEPDGTEIQIKSAFSLLDDILNSVSTATATKGASEESKESDADNAKPNDDNTTSQEGDAKMTREEFMAILKQLEDMIASFSTESGVPEEDAMAMVGEVEDELKALEDEEIEKMEDPEEVAEKAFGLFKAKIEKYEDNARKVKSAFAKKADAWKSNQPIDDNAYLPGANLGSNGSAGTPRLEIQDITPYDNWESADYSFALDMSRMSQGTPNPVITTRFINKAFMNQFADKAITAHKSGNVQLNSQAIKSINAIKADELDYSTQAGFGDEWVFTNWSEQIWDKPRLDLTYTQIQSIEMPSNPYDYPVEHTDPTVFFVPETTDEDQLGRNDSSAAIPDTKIGTNKVQFNAKKHALRVNWSAELDEDAIGAYLPKFRAQATRAVEDALELSSILGDVSTSGNINADGATPGVTSSYLAYDGLVHQALVTATTNSLDAAGTTPTLSHIRSIRALLGNAQGFNPANLAIFTDFPTYMKLLSIDAVVTIDKIGSQATVVSGSLGQIDGINIFVSGQMALADADGKITNAGNTVNRGRLAMVYLPDWFLGYRRRIASGLDYLRFADAWELVLTVRTALTSRSYSSAGAQQSSDDSVALLYNIGV